MHERPPLLNDGDVSDAGNQRLVYGYREMAFHTTQFNISDPDVLQLEQQVWWIVIVIPTEVRYGSC